jgi:hypothetical protein
MIAGGVAYLMRWAWQNPQQGYVWTGRAKVQRGVLAELGPAISRQRLRPQRDPRAGVVGLSGAPTITTTLRLPFCIRSLKEPATTMSKTAIC